MKESEFSPFPFVWLMIKKRDDGRKMTRRVEFTIIASRVIRLQGKSEKSSMPHFPTIKVWSLEFLDDHTIKVHFESISGKLLHHSRMIFKEWSVYRLFWE